MLDIKKNVVLAPYTSWKVGGPADFFFQPQSVRELTDALDWADKDALPLTLLGGGTNVLVSDKGIRGLVLHLGLLSQMSAIEQNGRLVVTAQAGVPKSDLVKIFMKRKLAPAIFLAGLPGDVGGGVVMNAGVGEKIEPREFVEITDWVEILKLDSRKIVRFAKSDLKWDYRKCLGWQPGIVLQAGFSWPLVEIPDLVEKVFAANRARISKQPLNLPSCGSVFRNPDNDKSGRLIESIGLKGFTVGKAQVSPKHANFIVNLGGATASDIHAVISHVRAEVSKNASVELETEVIYLGEW